LWTPKEKKIHDLGTVNRKLWTPKENKTADHMPYRILPERKMKLKEEVRMDEFRFKVSGKKVKENKNLSSSTFFPDTLNLNSSIEKKTASIILSL